ncbi:DoxX family membrane protein [Actinomycetes bacterium KLBMP 9797]
MRPVRGAAHAMLGAIFVASGARAVLRPDPLVPRAQLVTDRVPQFGKTDARTLVRLNGALQFVGGLLLATGHASRPAAAALAGSMVPTTVAGHPFWTIDDPAERTHQQVHFLKNLGLLGGLLLAAVDTEGRPGLGYRTGHGLRAVGRGTRRGLRTARREARIAAKSAAIGRHLPG